MIRKDNQLGDGVELRRRAEALVRKEAARSGKKFDALSGEDLRRMIHESRVEQVVLQLQNEGLCREQAELDAARAHYLELYDLAPVGYVTLSPKGVILEANLTAAALLGVSGRTMAGQPISAFILSEDQDVYYHHRKQLFAHSTGSTNAGQAAPPQVCELRMVKQDGAFFWARLEAVVAKEESGEPVCLLVLSDITEDKQTEEAVHLSERNLQTLFDAIDESVDFKLEIEKIISEISSSFVKLPPTKIDEGIDHALELAGELFNVDRSNVFRYASDGNAARNTHEWCKPGIESRLKPNERHDSLSYNFPWLFAKLKSFVPVAIPSIAELPPEAAVEKAVFQAHSVQSCLVVPLVSASKLIGHMGFDSVTREKVWSAEQISLLKVVAEIVSSALVRQQAEEALQESERKYRSIVENIMDGLVVHNFEGRILEVNENICRMLGYPHEELLGASLSLIDQGDDRELLPERLERLIDEGSILFEGHHVRKDGSLLATEVSAKVVTREGGGLIQGFVRDITELKQVEARIFQLQKAESLGRMAGAIAHHYNNLLAAVMGNLELAMESPQDSATAEGLTEAMFAVRRAAKMGRMMLAYLGKAVAQFAPLDLSQVCRQHLSELQADMPRGVILEAVLPSPGPAVRGNVEQLRQLLGSLIANAREAIGQGPGTVLLKAWTVSPADIPATYRYPAEFRLRAVDYACLEVTDSGCGMAESELEKIFDPFYSTKFTGRGLGLPVALGTVRAHDGCIAVESELARGSAFRVYLPLTTQEVPRANAAAEADATALREGGAVLLVEDEPMVRQMGARMLGYLGLTVLQARDGMEAVELFRQRRAEIGCVLCDLTMPGMNGWETLAALRRIAPDIPVILASGYDQAQVMEGAQAELPQAFLGKPYQLAGLKEALAKAMAGRDSR